MKVQIEQVDWDYSLSELSMNCMDVLAHSDAHKEIHDLIFDIAHDYATKLKEKCATGLKKCIFDDIDSNTNMFVSDINNYFDLVVFNNLADHVNRKYKDSDWMDDDNDKYFAVVQEIERISHLATPDGNKFADWQEQLDHYIAKM